MSARSWELPAAQTAEIDRRTFLGTAGALVAAVVVPLSVAQGEERPAPWTAGREPTGGIDSGDESWHVDDLWGHRPRYAHPIPHGPARTSPVLWERVEPIDYMLVI